MKHIFLLFLLFGSLSISYSQIRIESDSLVYHTTDSISEYVFDLHVINDGNIKQNVWWKIRRDALFPVNWELFMCDSNKCYTTSVTQCPPGLPNPIAAKDTFIFTFHFNPDTIGGIGHTWIELYADKSFKTLLFSTSPNGILNVNRNPSTAVVDFHHGLDDITIYPNPVNQTLLIGTSLNYDRLVILDLFGRQVMEHAYIDSGRYDCSKLQEGMYIIKLLNEKNKTLGLRKIMKS